MNVEISNRILREHFYDIISSHTSVYKEKESACWSLVHEVDETTTYKIPYVDESELDADLNIVKKVRTIISDL